MVIPAYRAASSIRSLVESVHALGLPVFVVDDASNDRTAEEARRGGARVLVRATNGGKGTALRQGLARSREDGFSWVVTLDADGQHLPSEIPRFLEEARRGEADLLLGNRMGNPRGMPLDRWLTNRFMSWVISRITGQQVPDSQCGFRMLGPRVLESVRLTSRHFEIESELVVRSAWAGLRVVSIPVSSVYRRQISFIRPIQDTVRFLRLLFSLRRSTFRKTAG